MLISEPYIRWSQPPLTVSLPRSEPAKLIKDILPTSFIKRRGTAEFLLLRDGGAFEVTEIGDDVFKIICKIACDRDEF